MDLFPDRYSKFMQAAQSCRAFLLICDDPIERTNAISGLAYLANVFQCELTGRAGEVWRVWGDTDGIDIRESIKWIQNEIWQLDHEKIELEHGVEMMMVMMCQLNKRVMKHTNIAERRGHVDMRSGWIWDESPRLPKLGWAILEYLYERTDEWITNKRFIDELIDRYECSESGLLNQRRILIRHGLIERKSPKSTLYRITESGIYYSIKKSS